MKTKKVQDKDINKMWLSDVPETCELCNKPFGKYFIDGDTGKGWALMCPPCHKKYGVGFGIGKAQKYVTKNRKGVEGFDE